MKRQGRGALAVDGLRARLVAVVLAVVIMAAFAGACTPDVGSSPPAPTSMEFDLTATPPLVPQPTALLVNPQTGLIDFGQTGTPLPADCSMQTAMTVAQCEFDQWLQTLNGFPSLTPVSAPASAALDPTTLTLGMNVDVFGSVVEQSLLTTGLAVAFDTTSNSLTVTPPGPWTLGELYWMGVRGYANGIRDAAGGQVVGSPTMALLKQTEPLTCGAMDPADVQPDCAGFQVVAQGNPSPAAAAAELFQLEAIRQSYGSGFAAMDASGLSAKEIAVLWGFPIHTNSVPLLLPPTAAVPQVPADDTIVVGVQGPVDPATVSAFVVKVQNGPVVVMDLTAVAAGDLNAGFPPVAAAYLANPGAIAIKFATPWPAGHEIGLFFTNALQSPAPNAEPLVASPASVLLSLASPSGSTAPLLVDSAGHSTVSGVSDTDAAALEVGRQALEPLLDNPVIAALTGITRANLVYCYAFVPTVMP